MERRALLGAGGTLAATALAGCLAGAGSSDAPPQLPPALEDPPTGVYRPTHVSGLRTVGVRDAGGFRFAALYSYPDRFWEVVGRTTYERPVEDADSVHLMALVWDPETGIVLPEVGLTVELLLDEELVAQEAVYAMLSQRLGFHYGDNFALPGDGEYTVRVQVGGLQFRRTGAFAGRFGEPGTAEFAFDYSVATRDGIERREPAGVGDPGAVGPADARGVPIAVAPAVVDLPGRYLGTTETGDARLAAVALTGADAARFDAETYLAISARTPYNGLVLPGMGLELCVERDGRERFAGILERTLDPGLGYHYGAAVPPLSAGDRLVFSVLTPPQVARHEGYETAFVEMPGTALSL